jgi:uncharacterized protein (DUF2062 family)
MFKRRNPLSTVKRVLRWLWPSIGWSRAYRYTMIRISRLPGSGYSVAGGFAWGAAMSFTPLIGLHFALSMGLAWLFRCNVVAAAIGTVVGNPWTFPLIWISLYKIGVFMGFGPDPSVVDADNLNFAVLFGEMTKAMLMGDWPYLVEKVWPVFKPMLVAAVPCATIVWCTFFFLLKPVVERYKNAVAKKHGATPAPMAPVSQE